MRKIRDVLRLKLEAKLSHQQIAAALDISKGVVTKYVALAKARSCRHAPTTRKTKARSNLPYRWSNAGF